MLSFRKITQGCLSNRKGVRGLYSFLILITLAGWVVVVIIFQQLDVGYQIENEQHIEDEVQVETAQRVNWILRGGLRKFDMANRVLTVEWDLLWIDAHNPRHVLDAFGSRNATRLAIGIYRDQELIPEKNVTLRRNLSNSEGLLPGHRNTTRRLENDKAVPVAIVGRHRYDAFMTDIVMGQDRYSHEWFYSLAEYPFDKWVGSIDFVANLQDEAERHNATNSFGTEINDAFLTDSVANWKITLETKDSCTTDSQAVNGEDEPCGLYIFVVARRAPVVILAAVAAVLTNWICALTLLFLACEAIFIGHPESVKSRQLLPVLVTALFALPTVRSILPGAPEFGVLNLVGIVPNVLIIALCTFGVSWRMLGERAVQRISPDLSEDPDTRYPRPFRSNDTPWTLDHMSQYVNT